MKIKLHYIYILTNAYNKILYTGVTNDLERRCFEHKRKIVKGYSRTKKITLITNFNKEWQELYRNERGEESHGVKTEIKINTYHI